MALRCISTITYLRSLLLAHSTNRKLFLKYGAVLRNKPLSGQQGLPYYGPEEAGNEKHTVGLGLQCPPRSRDCTPLYLWVTGTRLLVLWGVGTCSLPGLESNQLCHTAQGAARSGQVEDRRRSGARPLLGVVSRIMVPG